MSYVMTIYRFNRTIYDTMQYMFILFYTNVNLLDSTHIEQRL